MFDFFTRMNVSLIPICIVKSLFISSIVLGTWRSGRRRRPSFFWTGGRTIRNIYFFSFLFQILNRSLKIQIVLGSNLNSFPSFLLLNFINNLNSNIFIVFLFILIFFSQWNSKFIHHCNFPIILWVLLIVLESQV